MTGGMPAGVAAGDVRAIALASTIAALVLFGIFFNWLTVKVKSEKPRFPSSILVVFGVAATVIGAALIDAITGWGVIVCDLIAFAATGAAMVAGDVWRASGHSVADETEARIAAEHRRRASYNIGLGRMMVEVDRYGDAQTTVAESGPGGPEELG